MLIRPERPEHEDHIHHLTQAAFAPMAFSDETEAEVIRVLRASGDLTLGLVAERVGDVVGHIAFSPVTIDGHHDGWFGLGPISVRTDLQRQGIGKALVSAGLAALRARGARGCAVIGNPDIYGRIGFTSDGQMSHGALDPWLVQGMAFAGPLPKGELKFARAFDQEANGR